MAKKSPFSRKNLGIALIAALIIQFVLPAVNLGGLAWIATAIYLVVALLLIFS